MEEQCIHIDYKNTSLFLKKTHGLKALVLIHGGKASTESAKAMCERYIPAFPEYDLISIDYRFSGFGGKELDDVINGIRYAHSLSIPKVYLLGESHGGYLALMAGSRERISGIIDAYGITDLIAMKEYTEKENTQLNTDWQDYIQATLKECAKIGLETCLKKRSPYFGAYKIEAPVLLLHGIEDEIVPVNQSERLVEQFRHTGKKNFKFIALAGYSHGFSLLEGKVYHIIKDFLNTID
ncbi:MAG: prolyl oligopeptidase family serine peptidase [Candidatus Desulfofervidus auxilii]|nr:prolyl oligopeptidase family serine peptidase [Candidatus Desulfofervidus auxilii]